MKMIKKILMAHDSSEVSWKAFEWAADMAKKYNAELTVVHVIDTRVIPPIEHKDVILKPLKERAEKLEKEVKEKAKEFDLDVDFVVREGSPVDEITKTAMEKDVDLVVLGSRGLGNVSGYLLGSVSTKIVITCRKSVLIVKPEAPAASPLK
ncbi:universal stress protein A [Ignicoccus pacificus DSM 13166]|uniref:Universal stress protein A n=1 Tax=Ignicoccus pacificus DSM 13166 TaxID=940294 RepID=A0A977KA12_9CREN|nr:universal stress protein A [Ignicoccus pacificus DSM 13166]